jgi:hypothetical protein
MAGFSIDSAHIVRVLAKVGHTHRCVRCETRMLVKHESNLCVYCFNDLRTSLSEVAAGDMRVEATPRAAAPSTR